jgi:hypothetical protein
MPKYLIESARSCSKISQMCVVAVLTWNPVQSLGFRLITYTAHEMQNSMKPSFLSLALVKENSFVLTTRSLVERGQGPKHLQNTILMMTTLQETTQTMITMGLMMTSIRKRSSPIGHKHYLKLLLTLRRQQEHLLKTMTMIMTPRCFLRLHMKMTIPVGKPLNRYRHGRKALILCCFLKLTIVKRQKMTKVVRWIH